MHRFRRPFDRRRRVPQRWWKRRPAPRAVAAATGAAFAQGDKPVRFILPVATASRRRHDHARRAAGAGQGARRAGRRREPARRRRHRRDAGAGASPPDGTTLAIVSNNDVIYPSVYKSVPFDLSADITPIAVVGSTPIVLVVNPKVPAKNAQELIALLKAKPDELNYASSRQRHDPAPRDGDVPRPGRRQGEAHSVQGRRPDGDRLIGGQVEFGAAALPCVQQHIKAGALRAIGVGAAQRARRGALTSRRSSSRACRTTWSKPGSPSSAARSCRPRTVGNASTPRSRLRSPTPDGERGDGEAGQHDQRQHARVRGERSSAAELAKYAALVKKAGVELQ